MGTYTCFMVKVPPKRTLDEAAEILMEHLLNDRDRTYLQWDRIERRGGNPQREIDKIDRRIRFLDTRSAERRVANAVLSVAGDLMGETWIDGDRYERDNKFPVSIRVFGGSGMVFKTYSECAKLLERLVAEAKGGGIFGASLTEDQWNAVRRHFSAGGIMMLL